MIPKTIILNTQPFFERFFANTAKMTNCEYDLEGIVRGIWYAIGDTIQFEQRLAKACDSEARNSLGSDDQGRDYQILYQAINQLARDLHVRMIELNLYDEQGCLGYFPEESNLAIDQDLVLLKF